MTLPTHYVLDCSVTLAWFFEDEATPATIALFGESSTTLISVPELWLFELSNSMLNALRRKRTTETHVNQFLDRLLRQKLTIERTSSDRALSAIRHLAAAHDLSVYDATYLDLALRTNLPLATLDGRLTAACQSAGVGLAIPA
jgi:predicted nucleic acid-binding protein